MSYNRDYHFNNDKNGSLIHQHGEDKSKQQQQQQPVKLQPSWEERNLPEDELNFKNLTMDEASLSLHTPPDRLNLVYCVFLIHGIGVLMTWNMFITARNYFMDYKLSRNYTDQTLPYVSNFMQYMTFCSQVPNLIFNWMNIFVQLRGSLTTRIVWSIGIEVVVFLITVVLAMMDTSTWPDAFFYVTLICVVVLNMANGIYQNTIFGMAAKLPPKYTGAVVLGSNISGTFTAVVDLVSKKMTTNLKMAAIYYFITALFVLLICFDSYFALPLNRFYRHHRLKEKKSEEQAKQLELETNEKREKPPYLYILSKCSVQLFNVFFVFFVTLSIFPAVQSSIQRMDPNSFFATDDFTSYTCYLTFNVFAMIGSTLTAWFSWPSPKYLWIFVSLRVIFIPFFLLCNYQIVDVQRILPVVVTNDYVYWTVAIIMAFTSGYFSSLAMMYTPRMVEDKYAGTAGMFAAAFLITGIFAGIMSTFLWPWVVTHIGR